MAKEYIEHTGIDSPAPDHTRAETIRDPFLFKMNLQVACMQHETGDAFPEEAWVDTYAATFHDCIEELINNDPRKALEIERDLEDGDTSKFFSYWSAYKTLH